MSSENIFVDLDFSLEKTQYSDFTVLTNHNAIKQAIETILLTKKGDRVKFQNPYFGSNLHKLLFEKMTIFTVIQIREEIKTAINVWEPRIRILEVNVSPDYSANTYNININYKIVDINIQDTLILSLDVYK